MVTIQMTMNHLKTVSLNTNIRLDDINVNIAEASLNLGINEMLKEVAFCKMVELENNINNLEHNLSDGLWSEIANTLTEEQFNRILDYQESLLADIFTLAFAEGYKMMKKIATRGGNNMASFQKYDTSGQRWLYKMSVGIDPLTGKRKYTTRRGFKTKKDAQQDSIKLQMQLDTGKYASENKISFEDFIEIWFEEYKNSGVKNSTLANRRNTGMPHLKRLLGKYPINKVTRDIYQKMLLQLYNEGYSRQTISSIDIVAKLIFKNAVQRGIIREMPTLYTQIPKKIKTIEEVQNERIEEKYLEKDELLSLLHMAKTHGKFIDYGAILTLAYTGMRIGELLALKWDDIDFEEKSIHVWKTLFREKNRIVEFELSPPKTQKSNRKIFIDDTVLNTLLQIKEKQLEVKKAYPDYHEENFIFTILDNDLAGYPEVRHKLGYRLNNFLRKAGITKNITLHKLRHTHISLLAQAGVDLPTIQERVGHENAQTTTKIYLHVTKEMKMNTAQKFYDLMKN